MGRVLHERNQKNTQYGIEVSKEFWTLGFRFHVHIWLCTYNSKCRTDQSNSSHLNLDDKFYIQERLRSTYIHVQGITFFHNKL